MANNKVIPPSGRVKTLAYPLFFLALYTLIVKFVNPIVFYAAEGIGQGLADAPIMWDFWWAIHLFLGACLLRRERFAWALALMISIAEIIIIGIKFWNFWHHSAITFWSLSWYVNKCFVLSYFICLLSCLFLPSFRAELIGENSNAKKAS